MKHNIFILIFFAGWIFTTMATLSEYLKFVFSKNKNTSSAHVRYVDKNNINHVLILTCKKKSSIFKQPDYDIIISTLKNNTSCSNSKEINSELAELVTTLSNVKIKKFNIIYTFENYKYDVVHSGLGNSDVNLLTSICQLAVEFKKKFEE